jgi:outer membrane protein
VSRFVSSVAMAVFLHCIAAQAWATDWLSLASQSVAEDPRVVAAKARVDAVKYEVKGVWGLFYPAIHATASGGNSRDNDPYTYTGAKMTWGIEVAQSIPLFGRELSEVKKAKAKLSGENASFEAVQQEVIFEFYETVFRIDAAKQRLAFYDESMQLLSRKVEALQDAVRGGGVVITDLYRTKAFLESTSAQRDRAKTELDIQHARLQRLLGKRNLPETISTKERTDLKTFVSLDQKALLESALFSSPSIGNADAQVRHARAVRSGAVANFWPRLSLLLEAERGSYGDRQINREGIYLKFDKPLFEGGTTSSQASSAGFQLTAAIAARNQEESLVRERVITAWKRFQSEQSALEALQRAEMNDSVVVDMTEQQAELGAATLFTVLDARKKLVETKLEKIDQLLKQDLAWLQLLGESGMLPVLIPKSTSLSL